MEELFTGWFEVRNMKGEPNSTVHFQISTTAGKAVEFGMADSYTFGSSGQGSFRMRFAYHEIRYITITGLKKQPAPSDVVGYRLTSLGQRTGDFSCSSELISAIYNGTVNNYRGLTTGGMTVDCPHRERRGYGGDGHTSYQFALANYPVGAYFNKVRTSTKLNDFIHWLISGVHSQLACHVCSGRATLLTCKGYRADSARLPGRASSPTLRYDCHSFCLLLCPAVLSSFFFGWYRLD